jgi:hypothetical protein
MKPTVLLDYEFAVAQSGYVVRAILELEGSASSAEERAPMNSARSAAAERAQHP